MIGSMIEESTVGTPPNCRSWWAPDDLYAEVDLRPLRRGRVEDKKTFETPQEGKVIDVAEVHGSSIRLVLV